MRLLGFRLSSIITSFLAMAFGLLVYKYLLEPILPRVAEVYGDLAVTAIKIFVVVFALVYGTLILLNDDLVVKAKEKVE